MKLLTTALVLAASLALSSITGCPGSGSANGPNWPNAEKVKTAPLPAGASWNGVFFINTPGSRGTMHILLSGEDKIHGCWLAEDKHARATFVGVIKDNLAMFDWTQKRVGFAGAPDRVTAYLVMTPDPEGKHKVKGEYGENMKNDGGSTWEGVRQKNAEPKEDGCRLEEGDTLPSEDKPLN